MTVDGSLHGPWLAVPMMSLLMSFRCLLKLRWLLFTLAALILRRERIQPELGADGGVGGVVFRELQGGAVYCQTSVPTDCI